MAYANFSSNLPTGLQHFEFVDLTKCVDQNTIACTEDYHLDTINLWINQWIENLSE